MVREGQVLIATGNAVHFGAGYYVQALEVGAQVTEASSGLVATVAAGHGFAADDKLIVNLDVTQYRIVDSVTDTTITFTETLPLAEGDLLVNLADDTGSIAPNFDGAGLTVYTDMDYQNEAINNTVLSDSEGRYRYHYLSSVDRWELVRSADGPVAIYNDTGPSGAFIPFDLDSDGENEIETGATPFVGNDYLIYMTKTYDAALSTPTSGKVQAGILLRQRWTGNGTAAGLNRSGIFAINQFGDPTLGTDGGNLSGPSIAVGAYSEHYGDGHWQGSSFMGCEAAATIYGATTMAGAMFGCLAAANVANGTLGGTATITSFIGVRGIAQSLTGSSANITTAIGVDGVITQNAAGTMTNAYAMRSIFNAVTVGTITNAYGLRVEAVVAGSTANYGVYIGGASGGATTNEALYVATGRTTFADTTAFCVIKTNNTYHGDGTDRDVNIHFDTLTSDGAITYKGGSATNIFEFNKPIRILGANTTILLVSQATALITLSTGGTTTDTAGLLPANALILGVVARVTTTITTATNWSLGISGTPNRFTIAQTGLTAGTTVVGLEHLRGDSGTQATGPSQATAGTLRVTTTGTPGAGAIRVTVNYISFGAPAS